MLDLKTYYFNLTKTISFIALSLTIFSSCSIPNKIDPHTTKGAHQISFPTMVNTHSIDILLQNKKTYHFPSSQVSFSNEFDGARLNDVILVNDSTYEVSILPENDTINESSYYAFKIWSKTNRNLYIQLNYGEFHHRYIPKVSHDGTNWTSINKINCTLNIDSTLASFYIVSSSRPLWVAAQELKTSTMVYNWALDVAKSNNVTFDKIGKSKLGRDLLFLNIGTKPETNKKVIVVTSRQHPPEVPGHLAFESFIDELLKPSKTNKEFFDNYQIWVYPMLNPDGVDLGHWRHNAGGIDLNRDWACYRQPEIKTVVDHIADRANKYNSDVILGLDFHSTQEDVYYTLMDTMKHKLQNFHHYWIDAIDQSIPPYNSVTEPYPLNTPISKGWFYQYFNAEAITFEIGDETSREFIDQKGRAAAREMVKLLVMSPN